MPSNRRIEKAVYDKIRLRILAGLAEASGPVSFSEVMLWLGKDRGLARIMLNKMEKQGEVEANKHAGYNQHVLWRIPANADGLAAIYAPRCPRIPDASELRHVDESHGSRSRLHGASPYSSSSPLASVFLSW